MSFRPPSLRSGLLAASVLAASIGVVRDAVAAGISQGMTITATTTYSSTGSPCDAGCWEMWSLGGGLGQVMVEKDSNGKIVRSGRIVESYFADLYAMVDEANRKIPTSQRINRYGVVTQVHDQVGTCSASCAFAVDFGFQQDTVFYLDASGSLGISRAVADVSQIRELGSPDPVLPQPPHSAPIVNQCPGNAVGTNCYTYSYGLIVVTGTDGNQLPDVYGTIRHYYNEWAQLQYAQTYLYGAWSPKQYNTYNMRP